MTPPSHLDLLNALGALDALKARLDALRPLPPAAVRNLHDGVALDVSLQCH